VTGSFLRAFRGAVAACLSGTMHAALTGTLPAVDSPARLFLRGNFRGNFRAALTGTCDATLMSHTSHSMFHFTSTSTSSFLNHRSF
jgi:hypothetical protein